MQSTRNQWKRVTLFKRSARLPDVAHTNYCTMTAMSKLGMFDSLVANCIFAVHFPYSHWTISHLKYLKLRKNNVRMFYEMPPVSGQLCPGQLWICDWRFDDRTHATAVQTDRSLISSHWSGDLNRTVEWAKLCWNINSNSDNNVWHIEMRVLYLIKLPLFDCHPIGDRPKIVFNRCQRIGRCHITGGSVHQ